MTAENSVPFKVFLVQNDIETEIRRFSVSKDVVTSYVYLKQKLEMVFPSLREHPFIISWRGIILFILFVYGNFFSNCLI